MNNQLIIEFHDLNNQILVKLIKMETTIKIINWFSVLSLLFASLIFTATIFFDKIGTETKLLICLLIFLSTISVLISVIGKRMIEGMSKQFVNKYGNNLIQYEELIEELHKINNLLSDLYIIKILN